MLTLAIGWLALTQTGWPGVVNASSGLALETGACLRETDDEPPALQPVDCSEAHDGEVSGRPPTPTSVGPIPATM